MHRKGDDGRWMGVDGVDGGEAMCCWSWISEKGMKVAMLCMQPAKSKLDRVGGRRASQS